MYEPKHAFSRGQIVFNRRVSQIGGGSLDDSMSGSGGGSGKDSSSNLPAAKLPVDFHKPSSKYKKSIYNNAVAIFVRHHLNLENINFLSSLNIFFNLNKE